MVRRPKRPGHCAVPVREGLSSFGGLEQRAQRRFDTSGPGGCADGMRVAEYFMSSRRKSSRRPLPASQYAGSRSAMTAVAAQSRLDVLALHHQTGLGSARVSACRSAGRGHLPRRINRRNNIPAVRPASGADLVLLGFPLGATAPGSITDNTTPATPSPVSLPPGPGCASERAWTLHDAGSHAA